MERREERTEGGAGGHLRKGVDVLREALAAVAEFAVRAGHVGMGVVDVAREEAASVDLCPVGPHFLAILLDRVEVGDLVGAKDIVRVLREFGLERGHHRELLRGEDLSKKVEVEGRGRGIWKLYGEHHRLLFEVLDMRPLREELGHVAHLVSCLLREAIRGAGENRRPHKDWHIGELRDELLHERQVLRPVIFRRHMDLQEGDVDLREIVVVPLRRVGDEKPRLGIVLLEPVLEGSTHEAAADDADVDHKENCLIV